MICHYVLTNLPMFFSLKMTPVFWSLKKNLVFLSTKSRVPCPSANKLVLNINETNIINVAPKQSANPLLAVSFGNLVMNKVPVIKFVGIQIDSKMNWNSHVEFL
jgi:hypothetical protein